MFKWYCGFINNQKGTEPLSKVNTQLSSPDHKPRLGNCDAWNVHLPQPHPRGTRNNWLAQSVYLRAFISVCCPENWPWVTFSHCIVCCKGYWEFVCIYPVLWTFIQTQYAIQYTLWRSKSYKFMVLWTWTIPGRDDVETELWEGQAGKGHNTEAMTRVHKVK